MFALLFLPLVLALILQVFLELLPGAFAGIEGGRVLLDAGDQSKLWLGGGGAGGWSPPHSGS